MYVRYVESLLGMKTVTGGADNAAILLATSSNVTIGGSVICVILAVLLGVFMTRLIS